MNGSFSDLPSVERIGKRRRGPDPALIVVVIVLVFIAVAVTKPWDLGRPAPSASLTAVGTHRPSPTPTDTPAPSTDPTATPLPPSLPATGSPLDLSAWQPALSAAVHSHPDWGIRTLSLSTDVPGSLAEAWAPDPSRASKPRAADGCPGDDGSRITVQSTTDTPIVAIGVTTPHQQAAIDVRIWLGTDLYYVATSGVTVPGQGTDLVYQSSVAMSPDRTWRPGTYRLDILTGTCIVHMHLDVRGDLGSNAIAAVDDIDDDTVKEGTASFDIGAFAMLSTTIDEVAVRTTEFLGQPILGDLDQRSAWLGLGNATPGDIGQFETPMEAASVLGVSLGQSGVTKATLSELAPSFRRLPVKAEILEAPGLPGVGGTRQVVVFRSPSGAWNAGTYRIDVTWSAGRQTFHELHLLDIYPSVEGTRPTFLVAARNAGAAERRGHGWGIADSLTDAATRQTPNKASFDPAVLGTSCDGGQLVPPQRVLRVDYAGPPARHVTVTRHFSDGSSVRVDAQVVMDALPGTILITPLANATWPPGYYSIAVANAQAASTLVFCAGVLGDGGSVVVPPGADVAPPDLPK